MQKHGWWCACLLSMLWTVVERQPMTCVGSCICNQLQLLHWLHRLLLLRSNAASLASFSLHQARTPNSSSSQRNYSQTAASPGLNPGSHMWVCGSSLQLVCLCLHLMASAASQNFCTLQLY